MFILSRYGMCPGCNRPCLHPDKVRPSLEAFGFDIARTLSELFGIELLGKERTLRNILYS
ncbi:MAG: DUF2284 domain-containing protein [Alistipes sp.]